MDNDLKSSITEPILLNQALFFNSALGMLPGKI